MTAAPKVRLATLRERTSASGTRYMTGLLGDARLLLFRDEDADNEWGEGWALLIEERAPRTESAIAPPVRHRRVSKRAPRPAAEAVSADRVPFDDPVPL